MAYDARGDRYYQTYDAIATLPFEDVRRQAEFLLTDPQKFECIVSPLPADKPLAFLAPCLQSLFSRFESIYVVGDEAFLSRSEVELFDWDGNGLSWGLPFWKIGAAHGHSLTLVRPHEELVYDEEDGSLGEPLPSVFHWLLWVSTQASDFAL